jgi:ribosomal protein S18 acetylase RimI-like enzyme
MQAAATLRPATKADTAALAVLVDIAGEGLPAHLWSTLRAPGQSTLEIGRERAAREEGGFSYRNAVMAEIDGEIAACLIGYRLDDPYDLGDVDALPELARPLVKLEARVAGSWYVNVLATFPEFRGRGLGRQLLRLAETKARESGASALSVIVAGENERAARLYASCGYGLVAAEPVFLFPGCPHGGDWQLMAKTLPADG